MHACSIMSKYQALQAVLENECNPQTDPIWMHSTVFQHASTWHCSVLSQQPAAAPQSSPTSVALVFIKHPGQAACSVTLNSS